MIDGVELGTRGVLRPGKWRWLRALGWMLALFLIVMVAYGGLYGTITMLMLQLLGLGNIGFNAAPAEARLPASIIGAIGCLAAYAALVRGAENRPVRELSLRALPIELPIGLAAGAAFMAVTIGVMWAFGAVTVAQAPMRSVLGALQESVQSGVVEETLFRLVVFRLIWRAFGIWAALVFSAFFFGFGHISNPGSSVFAAICIAFEAGILLAAFYILTGRIWMAIGVHAGWNFTQGWVFGAAVSGTKGFAGGPLVTAPAPGVPAVFTGGAFGPEASLACLVICTAAGTALLWMASRRGLFKAIDEKAPAVEASRAEPIEAPAA